MGQAPSSSSSSSSSAPTASASTGGEPTMLDVELHIVSAKDIAAGDFLGLTAALRGQLGSSDAYVVIEVDGKKVAWTRPIFNTLEPVWNEAFFFRNVRADALCRLYLFDKDMDADDPLGETHFHAPNTDGRESVFHLPITWTGRPAGVISVKVKSRPIAPERNALLMQYGPVHYSVHSSVATGIITLTTSHNSRLESLAYHVELQNLPVFLPTEHEWNKNYPAIQRIFSPNRPEAPVLRKAISAQHALIYMHNPNTVYSSLASPADFFRLVHDGQRLDKPVLFTYAITAKGWYFSETGAAFFKDMLSKHMLHACAQLSVLYAGEFHIQNSLFGHPKLVIDNNSGTYAPPKEDLPRLKALFENNFPGLAVEALDRDDPELQKARKEILDGWA